MRSSATHAELVGGIEAGGTKMICAVASASAPGEILASEQVATGDPEPTMAVVGRFFLEQAGGEPGRLRGLGVASFGPIDVDRTSGTYGHLTPVTPKLAWRDFDLLGSLRRGLEPVADSGTRFAIDTDVNGAAMAEWRWGVASGTNSALYVTVGTGIGGGAVVNGATLRGFTHPEMGHVFVPRHPDDDRPNACEFHPACLEGFASGSAIRTRFGHAADAFPEDHDVWEFESHYLGHGLATVVLVLSPQVIVLGGGVMHQRHLYEKVDARLRSILEPYVATPPVLPPKLGDDVGVLGAIALVSNDR